MAKRRRIATLSLAAALVGAVCVGGTLAYFTDSDNSGNVITTGNINITLYNQLAEEADGVIDSVVPNQTIQNVISVTNDGKNDAFLRLAVDYSASEISMDDILDTFVGTYSKTSGSNSYATEEEAIAAVAALAEKGVTASYEAVTETTTLITPLVTENTSGSQKCWYKQIELTNGTFWQRIYCKKNLNGEFIIQGEKYVSTTPLRVQDGAEAGVLEPISDSVDYVLVQNDAEGYIWERHETIEQTGYVVSYEGCKYTDDGISKDAWTMVNNEANNVCYFYYNEVFNQGETAEFLDSMHFPANWGNAYADKSISMQVTAEAVQADHLEKADGTLATTAEEAFAIVTTIEAYEAE